MNAGDLGSLIFCGMGIASILFAMFVIWFIWWSFVDFPKKEEQKLREELDKEWARCPACGASGNWKEGRIDIDTFHIRGIHGVTYTTTSYKCRHCGHEKKLFFSEGGFTVGKPPSDWKPPSSKW